MDSVEWQDIATAPRDGRVLILALDTGHRAPFIAAGWWSERGLWEIAPDGAWSSVTHWLPLPPPPIAHGE